MYQVYQEQSHFHMAVLYVWLEHFKKLLVLEVPAVFRSQFSAVVISISLLIAVRYRATENMKMKQIQRRRGIFDDKTGR